MLDDNTKDDAIRKAKNEYLREWRKKNKDKVKEIERRYWEKKIREQSENLKDDD